MCARWKRRKLPQYVTIQFGSDSPVFYCPGPIFAGGQCVRAGKFEKQGRRLRFIRQYDVGFVTDMDVYRLEKQLERFVREVPQTEYDGHLGKGQREVRLNFCSPSQIKTAIRKFPDARPVSKPEAKISKPLIVRLSSTQVKESYRCHLIVHWPARVREEDLRRH